MARKKGKKPKKKKKRGTTITFGGRDVRVRTLVYFGMIYATLYIILVGLAIYYFDGILFIGDFPILLIDWLDAFFGVIFPVIFLSFFLLVNPKIKKQESKGKRG